MIVFMLRKDYELLKEEKTHTVLMSTNRKKMLFFSTPENPMVTVELSNVQEVLNL